MSAQEPTDFSAVSQPERNIPKLGEQFGRLTITDIHQHTIGFRVTCACTCGKIWQGQYNRLLHGYLSCGCLRQELLRHDLTGQQFGRLTVLSMTWEPDLQRGREGRLRGIAYCQCVCGTLKRIPTQHLVSPDGTRSCGCSARKDYSGQRFGRLLVQRMVKGPRHYYLAECLCDCGNITIVAPSLLTKKRTRSCGCLKEDWLHSIRKPLQHKKDVSRLGRHRRRALIKNLPMHFTQAQVDFMLHYWQFSCAVCNRQEGGLWHIIALDHFIPVTDPQCPGTVPGNMLPLCQTRKGASKHVDIPGCNHNKLNKDPVLWLKEKLGARKATSKLKEIETYFRAAEAFAASLERAAS